MDLPLLPLPKTTADERFIVGAVILAVLLVAAGRRIVQLQAALDAKPLVTDFKSDDRTEDVRRGPVKISRTTTTEPDGRKVVVQVREVAAEERHTEDKTATIHQETPVQAPGGRARTRYVGLGINPLDYAHQGRLRAGVTLFGAFDAGVALDVNPLGLGFSRPMLELTYRF